jgi:antitoxin FitA
LPSRLSCARCNHSSESAAIVYVTIRDLSDEAHRALKVRAARNNGSTEAEMRAILEEAARPEGRLRLGAALAKMSPEVGLTDEDMEGLTAAGERHDGRILAALRRSPMVGAELDLTRSREGGR